MGVQQERQYDQDVWFIDAVSPTIFTRGGCIVASEKLRPAINTCYHINKKNNFLRILLVDTLRITPRWTFVKFCDIWCGPYCLFAFVQIEAMGLSHTDTVMDYIRFATKVYSGFWQSHGYADVWFLLPCPIEIYD